MNLFLKFLRCVSFQLAGSVQIVLVLAVCLSISSCLPVRKSRMSSPTSKTEPASIVSPAKPIPELKAKIQLPETLPERVKAWRLIVDEAIKESGSELFGSWNCMGFTMMWLQRMNTAENIVLSLAESNGVGIVKLKDGTDAKQHISHTFAVDRGLCKTSSNCAEEIIIDAAYLLFLVGGECRVNPTLEGCADKAKLAELPPVLVGSPIDVIQFYSKLSIQVKRQPTPEEKGELNWQPYSAASLIYSLGINSNLRLVTDGRIK